MQFPLPDGAGGDFAARGEDTVPFEDVRVFFATCAEARTTGAPALSPGVASRSPGPPCTRVPPHRRTSNGPASTFTVRKSSYGVGVERTFPIHSPRIEKIEVKSRGEVRRSRLFYLRDLSGKAARIKERKVSVN